MASLLGGDLGFVLDLGIQLERGLLIDRVSAGFYPAPLCLLEHGAEVCAGVDEVGVGNTQSRGDRRVEVGHKEAGPGGRV